MACHCCLAVHVDKMGWLELGLRTLSCCCCAVCSATRRTHCALFTVTRGPDAAPAPDSCVALDPLCPPAPLPLLTLLSPIPYLRRVSAILAFASRRAAKRHMSETELSGVWGRLPASSL